MNTTKMADNIDDIGMKYLFNKQGVAIATPCLKNI